MENQIIGGRPCHNLLVPVRTVAHPPPPDNVFVATAATILAWRGLPASTEGRHLHNQRLIPTISLLMPRRPAHSNHYSQCSLRGSQQTSTNRISQTNST